MAHANFKPVEEQLAYLKKGVAEIIPEPVFISAWTQQLPTFTSGTPWSFAS
jgi:hypothetical protein